MGRPNAGWSVYSVEKSEGQGYRCEAICVYSLSTHVHTQTADAHTCHSHYVTSPFPSHVVNFLPYRYSLCVIETYEEDTGINNISQECVKAISSEGGRERERERER